MNIIQAALRRPSLRTQIESSLVGIVMIMTSSIGIAIYMIGFTPMALTYKILIGIADFGVLFFIGPNLITLYAQLYALKMEMNLYPPDMKLYNKIQEAETIKNELEELIKLNKENPLVEKVEVENELV